ncbi:amidohydrolase [Mycobacterium sp.]|jgi:hypothetical protein|uniref:amidohydrolase n=1 Tax=Mycobacterium sp. TaxID=1785 RepID=UPI003340465B|nr:hypothetical protein [Mycobacterium sp.]
MTRSYHLEAAIAASASRHPAAQRCPAGGAAPAARTWIETLHVRAQIRAERHLRGPRQ